MAEVTSGTVASLELTVPSYVTGAVQVVGVMRSDEADVRSSLNLAINNFSSTNAYRMQRLSWTADCATATSTFQAIDGAWLLGACIAGANAAGSAGSGEYGSVDVLIPEVVSGKRKRIQATGGVLPSTTDSDAVHVVTQGRCTDTSAISTIQLSVAGGANFVAGTRFELWPV